MASISFGSDCRVDSYRSAPRTCGFCAQAASKSDFSSVDDRSFGLEIPRLDIPRKMLSGALARLAAPRDQNVACVIALSTVRAG
jgi:hypothetical protein